MKHRILYMIFLLTIMSWGAGLLAVAQPEANAHAPEDANNIYCEALVFESNQLDSARLEIYLQVPYSEISFVHEDREYVGRYEISAVIQDTMQQQVWQQNQSVELHAKDFSQTVSSKLSSFKQFSVSLSSGTYALELQIIDQESKKTVTIKRRVVINPFLHQSLMLSDILLVNRVNNEGGRTNIIPNLTGDITHAGNRLYLYFEIYARTKLDSVALTLVALNEKRDTVLRQEKTVTVNGLLTQSIWELQDSLLPVSPTTLTIDVHSFQNDSTGKLLHAKAVRNLFVHLKDLPFSINDLDKATEQLQYIAKGSEIDSIQEAQTPAEKKKRFLEFWQKHNPNTSEKTNSLMEEYYARVQYANKHFSRYREGWKTDMGMVSILFGLPENIERHPFDANNKPYEIWYYYNLGRQFIFVDRSGFDDYQLTYPTTDLWGRIY
jgi:GWxTD domain-containing protein